MVQSQRAAPFFSPFPLHYQNKVVTLQQKKTNIPQLWRQGNSNKCHLLIELVKGIQRFQDLSLSIAETKNQRMNVLLPAPCVQIHAPLVLENPSTGMKCIVDAKIKCLTYQYML